MPRQPHILCLIACLCVALPGRAAHGQEREEDLARKVKAGMLIEFARYTKWPEDRFADDRAPVVIAVLGDKRLSEVLDAIVRRGEITLHNRPVVVRQFDYPDSRDRDAIGSLLEELKGSHLLYIGDTERQRVRDILRGLGNADVLTVSELPRFAERGGMIGLVLQRKYVFDVGSRALENTRVRISSKVLDLARKIIKTQED